MFNTFCLLSESVFWQRAGQIYFLSQALKGLINMCLVGEYLFALQTSGLFCEIP